MNERYENALVAQEHEQAKRLAEAESTRQLGVGVGFERTRRITGYLVGSLDRFNNAKRCEERDRVKHG